VTRDVKYNNTVAPENFRLLPILMQRGWSLGGQEIVLPMSKGAACIQYNTKTVKLQFYSFCITQPEGLPT
jgi:hypothetical protein